MTRSLPGHGGRRWQTAAVSTARYMLPGPSPALVQPNVCKTG